MQHLSLLAVDKARGKPFFDRLTDLFHEHHHSADQDAEGYEVLLYKVHRPYTNGMLDMVDEWMGLDKRDWREETTREVKLAMYAIRYPDTLLLDSFTPNARSDIVRLSSYLHFTQHTYAIWDEDTRKGLAKLGIEIPATEVADPFIYGSYVSAIEFFFYVDGFT